MPICEADPWRLQYFAHVKTAANIPTEDCDAWQWYPAHRWVYDKLAVALSQNLDAGPHGMTPPHFPVFSKPIVNLKGMGVGSRVLQSAADYERHYAPGHFWMTLLEAATSHPTSRWSAASRAGGVTTGKPAGEGTFDYWTVHAEPDADIESRCGAWVQKNLAGYTGMLNLETIGGTIIEVHLRFADQWPDLYGAGWVDALVGLYESGDWDFYDDDRSEGYSVVLFGPNGRRYRHPPRRWSKRSSARPASPACRSPSTRTARQNSTPCRPAASAWPSSTVSISARRSPRASGSGIISSTRRRSKS